MPVRTPQPDDTDGPFTQLDDEQYNDLVDLEGQKVVHVAVWEDALADALADLPDSSMAPAGVDLDLYLKDGAYFELYGTVCYPSLDDEPMTGQAEVEARLKVLVQNGVWLEEIAADEEDGLVLVLSQQRRPVLFIQVGAWLVNEWEELPDAPTS